VVPLRDEKGEIFAIMFVLLDITMVKQAQLELKKLNKGLESKILESTAQLNVANKRLESFCYSVSHDLRAPLRAVAGYASVLQDDYAHIVKDEDFNNITARLITSASKMETLVKDLLNFLKSELQELSYTPIDMNKLIYEILNELTIQESSRKLEINISPLATTQGDLNLLRQVWTNLLSNALKYTRKKDFTKIEIACTSDHETACYSIADNGAGFNMKYVDKGTGVGLALVKSIVLRHGGKIWAESEVNQGSKFYFTLPLRQ
jgi:signal transduction histidine kinase